MLPLPVRRLFPIFGVLVAGCFAFAARAAENAAPGVVLQELSALLERGAFAEAYALGRAHADALGNAEFDLLFGIAAINAGHLGDGVLALQRAVTLRPDSLTARLHLARAYYLARDDIAAAAEFKALAKEVPPAQQEQVAEYLRAIEQRGERFRTQAHLRLEMGGGYDSNLTTGIAPGTEVSLPGIGMLPPPAENSVGVRASDQFGAALISARVSSPLAPGWQYGLQAALDERRYEAHDNSLFDQRTISAGGGISSLGRADLWRLALGYSQIDLAQSRYLNTVLVGADWMHDMGAHGRSQLGVQVARLNYADACLRYLREAEAECIDTPLSTRNSRYTAATAGWAWPANGFGIAHSLAINLGRERNRTGHADLSRWLAGARYGAQAELDARLSLNGGIAYQRTRHDEDYPLTDAARRDTITSFDATLSYRLDASWSVRADWSWTRQESNIGFLSYRRTLFNLKLCYEL